MPTRKAPSVRSNPGKPSSIGVASNEPPSTLHTPPFLVAGVGASAGGLEAFSRVLDPITRETRLAIVLVHTDDTIQLGNTMVPSGPVGSAGFTHGIIDIMGWYE